MVVTEEKGARNSQVLLSHNIYEVKNDANQ